MVSSSAICFFILLMHLHVKFYHSTYCAHIFTYRFTRAVKITVLGAGPVIFSMYFNAMCEQHHMNALNPLSNGKKNGYFNGTC